jgi:hypothetical protein
MSFLISASEAVLLGRALEEYLRTKDDDDNARFLGFLWSRVRPFSPSIARDRWERVRGSDLPYDLEWEATEVGRFGFAHSLPNSWFVDTNETDLVVRITRDHSTRSLVDLVAEIASPHVERWAADDVAFKLAIPGATCWGQFQQRLLVSGEFDLQDTPTGSDDPAAIEAAIVALVKYPDNAHDEFFAMGRTIGEILGHCELYEADFRLFDELEITHNVPFSRIDQSTWRSLVLEPLRELMQVRVFEPFSAAVTLLAAQERALELEFDQNDWETEFRTLQSVRSAVWLALGELLHLASRSDASTPARGERPTLPRMLRMTRLTKDSSADKIRATLQLCEGLFEDRTASIFPEVIVSTLASGIEALARRVWPRAFAGQGAKPDLGSVLHERCRNGNEQERRFASIASMLYKTYRNASQHDFDNFRCTWSEAFFFFCGMRQLWQLSEELAYATRRPGQ